MPGLTPQSQWTDFTFTVERDQALQGLLLPLEKYQRYGYRKEPFTHSELLHKYEAYCKRCSAAFALKPEANDDLSSYKSESKCVIHPGRKLEKDRIWSCCNTTIITYPGEPSGCLDFPAHDWINGSPLPRGFWDLHPTPPFRQPETNRPSRPRVAVSLDCEMATNRFNQPELIKLTLVDFFSKEVLIDSLVRPQAKIKNMLTSLHGITYKDIAAAVRSSEAILGRDAAREKLFHFVGPETIVLVHGGLNDFLSLRWYHHAILDTQEVESRIKRIGDDELADWLADEGTSLEAMSRLKTGVHIRKGNGIHDSLEDAMACRELGVWYANNLKGEIGLDDQDVVVGATGAEHDRMGVPGTQAVQNVSHNEPTASRTEPKAVLPEATTSAVKTMEARDTEALWNCKACKMRVREEDKLKHRMEKSHMDRLIALVQQKGG
ncbi:hypothetical protein Dda_7233 [Drechslerella dactyloides]|uniref:Exonuclease domain-containing protein n=1 Tax=Drechslerella dactyloides TaxID=74499 RepID=A0AAD6IT08_DREDA|nr:hypothetical protein Dda_7233 [Drechslerella dactyloides]